MIVRYDPGFLQKIKKLDVRIRRKFREQITIFQNDPFAPQLNNHALQRGYTGLRSINITNDWRALYLEKEENEVIAYFVEIGTHEQLYV